MFTVTERAQLGLSPFADNRTFLGGDIIRFMSSHPLQIAHLLELLLQLYVKGDLHPVTPIVSFDAEHIKDALKLMQEGSHIGKIVIKFPEEETLSATPTIPSPKFRSDATYVLTGGLGGLGKAIAAWMASHGAKNLMFLSRSAGKSSEDQEFFKELRLMGCSSQYFAIDIGNATAMKEAISQASVPIAGAMHMAMVLADRSVFDMDLETWKKPLGPKIQGAWNLHNLLPNDMDFLVLFSSVSGLYGYYGQSSYAAGNTFLDSFAQYRQGLGLPASVISIGPMDDVGFVSRTASTQDALRTNLAILLTETYFLSTLQLAIARSSTEQPPVPSLVSSSSPRLYGFSAPSHIVHACETSTPIMDPENGTMWKRDPRMSIYRNIQKVDTTADAAAGGGASKLKAFLGSVAKDPAKLDQKASADTIARELGQCVSNFLMKGPDEETDLSLSLEAAGVDSLVAIETRNWWKQNLGVDVSVLELLAAGSIEQLGVLAAQRLKAKYTRGT